uniref:Putative gamma-glutamylcyclotransferase n=1 Tax=Kalanchoe fedtschenkoi TaxID=63787 RepID=A0A7N0TWT0_KALFE
MASISVSSHNLQNVFVYGSLLADEIFLLGITPPELEVLDAFEDVEYERRDVELSLEDSSEKLHAYAYVWENKNDANLYGDWDFEAWKRDHLKDFAAMTKDFMKELEQPESKPRVATYEQFYEQDKQ